MRSWIVTDTGVYVTTGVASQETPPGAQAGHSTSTGMTVVVWAVAGSNAGPP